MFLMLNYMLTIGLFCFALPPKLSDEQLVITCRYYDSLNGENSLHNVTHVHVHN